MSFPRNDNCIGNKRLTQIKIPWSVAGWIKNLNRMHMAREPQFAHAFANHSASVAKQIRPIAIVAEP